MTGTDAGATARLTLHRPGPGDAAELFAMYADPRVSEGDPALRHGSIARTRAVIERWEAAWRRDGVGLWVLRARQGPDAGRLVGVGGCGLPTPLAWNLAFTLRPEFWGQGYAQEVAREGIRQARERRPELPVTAVVAPGNARSHGAVERAGLTRVGRVPDPQDADAELLLYADRPLSPDELQALTTQHVGAVAAHRHNSQPRLEG